MNVTVRLYYVVRVGWVKIPYGMPTGMKVLQYRKETATSSLKIYDGESSDYPRTWYDANRIYGNISSE